MNSSKNQQTANNRLIRRKEVQAKTGLGASSIYAMMKQGITLSERRVAWLESDVDQWITDRIEDHKTSIATMEV